MPTAHAAAKKTATTSNLSLQFRKQGFPSLCKVLQVFHPFRAWLDVATHLTPVPCGVVTVTAAKITMAAPRGNS